MFLTFVQKYAMNKGIKVFSEDHNYIMAQRGFLLQDLRSGR